MRAAACRLHGIFTPHDVALSMLTNQALEQLHVAATKRAAHSSEQYHHADHSCAACCLEKQPAGTQPIAVPWRSDAATATWMDGPDVHTSESTFTAVERHCLRVFGWDKVRCDESKVVRSAHATRPSDACVRTRQGYPLRSLTGGSYTVILLAVRPCQPGHVFTRLLRLVIRYTYSHTRDIEIRIYVYVRKRKIG
jgi:hypothetical protein